MRVIASCRSRLFASASSTSRFRAASSNSVHQRSIPDGGAIVGAGSSRTGGATGVVWQLARTATAIAVAASLAIPAKAETQRLFVFIGSRMFGSHGRMAGRLRHAMRMRVCVVDFAQELGLRAPLDEPALEDDLE